MYLRQLEIFGFKSFAQKTELNFPLGVAAVVGPNGCGKSNVLDALRWGLGEQSAKALRGGEMSDVIFSGTDSRAAVNVAEVSLTFADCEADLGTDYNEVRITRRVYRDGRGEYLLNKTACRLRDIQELFMDTGIGRSAYSIMEQGKIDLILSSRPEDRRAIFEEAAGITKYKAQRREATRKLEQTDGNLLRLSDVLAEVKRQVAALQRQAAKARRYQAVSTDLRLLDTHLSREQYNQLEGERRHAREELARVRTSQALLERHLEEGEAELAEQRATLERLLSRLNGARAGAQEWKDRLRQAESRLEFNQERAAESESLLGRYEAELSSTVEGLRLQEEQLLAADDEQRSAVALLEAGRVRLQEQEALVQDARKQRADAERSLQNTQQAANQAEARVTQLRVELTRLTHQQQTNEVRRDLLAAEVARFEATRDDLLARASEARTQLAESTQTLDTRRQESRAADETQAAAQKELAGADILLASVQRNQAAWTSKLDVLRQLNQAGTGLAAGTQAVLRGLDQPHLFKSAIVGALGTLIEVEEQFIPAVEAVLGRNLQAILIRDEEVAAAILQALATGKKLGRATLALSPEGTSAAAPAGVPAGAIGWVAGVVKAQPAAEKLIHRLLAGVLITETLAAAQTLRGSSRDHSIVTLAGEWLGRDGLWQAGAQSGEDAGQGLLQRQAQIKTLEGEAAAGQREVAEATELRQKTAARVQEAAVAVAEIRASLQTVQVQASTLQSQLGLLERELREITFKADNLRREHVETTRRCEAATDQVRAVQGQLDEQATTFEAHQGQRHDLAAAVEAARDAEAALNATFNEVRLNVATEQQRHEGLRRQRQPMDARRTELAALIERRRSELAEHRARIDRYEGEAGSLEEEIETARVGLAEGEAQIQVRQQECTAARQASEQTEASLRHYRQELSTWHERRASQEIRETQVGLRQENLHGQILAHYQIDLRDFRPDFPAFQQVYAAQLGEPDAFLDWPRVETIVRALRQKLDNIGAVNLDAIGEYDALEERHRFLEAQHADLLAAKNELQTIIARINATTRTLFAETFERVRVNFQEMFTELFGGGKANLLLTNENEPLECGIDIIARPPGKQLQSITLLSGGEKTMTAVALLFSIYMVKPSPFCVLDEMDAPLDESNISRFLKILDRFVSQSQFIVITHNKRTIARADVLYGVTMEEAGVSKLVAVRLAKRDAATSAENDGTLADSASHPERSIAEAFGKSGNLHSENITAEALNRS